MLSVPESVDLSPFFWNGVPKREGPTQKHLQFPVTFLEIGGVSVSWSPYSSLRPKAADYRTFFVFRTLWCI